MGRWICVRSSRTMPVTARPPLAFSAGFASSLCCPLIGRERGASCTSPQMDLKEQYGAGPPCPWDSGFRGSWCGPSEQMGFQNTSPCSGLIVHDRPANSSWRCRLGPRTFLCECLLRSLKLRPESRAQGKEEDFFFFFFNGNLFHCIIGSQGLTSQWMGPCQSTTSSHLL